MTSAEMTAHVEALAKAAKVHISWQPNLKPDEASGTPEKRLIEVAPITDDVSYLIVLHELGHYGSGATTLSAGDNKDLFARALGFGNSPRLVAEERAATAWAKAQAKVWTPAMERAAAEALQTYLDDPFTGPAWMAKELASRLRLDEAKGARP